MDDLNFIRLTPIPNDNRISRRCTFAKWQKNSYQESEQPRVQHLNALALGRHSSLRVQPGADFFQ